MFKINSRVKKRLGNGITKFKRVFAQAKSRDVNESDTVSILEDTFAEVFGYDKYFELTKEFVIRGTYCDLAVKVDEKVQFLIEVKAIGITLKQSHIKQAIDYGANKGISWVILTNGINWRIYKIKFEKPINFELIEEFSFLELDKNNENDLDILYILTKEGLAKNEREEYYEKIQTVNRYIVGNIILQEPVIKSIRRELRKFAEGLKVEDSELVSIIKDEVIKRDLQDSDKGKEADLKLKKYYKKLSRKKSSPPKPAAAAPVVDKPAPSITEQLLNESQSAEE
jgi:hypothetical protein